MKWIHLGHEYFACIDDEDFEQVGKYIWRYHPRGYARTHQVNFGGKDVFLHDFLLPEKKQGQEIDHSNRAPWDNRRGNLKIVEVWQNQQNKGLPINPPLPTRLEMDEAISQRKTLKASQPFLSNEAKKRAKTRRESGKLKKVRDSQGNIFLSARDAADFYGAPYTSNIVQCCLGSKRRAYGQEWSYVD